MSSLTLWSHLSALAKIPHVHRLYFKTLFLMKGQAHSFNLYTRYKRYTVMHLKGSQIINMWPKVSVRFTTNQTPYSSRFSLSCIACMLMNLRISEMNMHVTRVLLLRVNYSWVTHILTNFKEVIFFFLNTQVSDISSTFVVNFSGDNKLVTKLYLYPYN